MASGSSWVVLLLKRSQTVHVTPFMLFLMLLAPSTYSLNTLSHSLTLISFKCILARLLNQSGEEKKEDWKRGKKKGDQERGRERVTYHRFHRQHCVLIVLYVIHAWFSFKHRRSLLLGERRLSKVLRCFACPNRALLGLYFKRVNSKIALLAKASRKNSRGGIFIQIEEKEGILSVKFR